MSFTNLFSIKLLLFYWCWPIFSQVPETRACSHHCIPRWPNSFPGSQWNGGGKQCLKANCTFLQYNITIVKGIQWEVLSHLGLWIPVKLLLWLELLLLFKIIVSVSDFYILIRRSRKQNDFVWLHVSFLPRTYGRAPKMIHLEANFVQFKEELLPKEGNKALLTFPFLHIYWTDCCVSSVL